MMASLTLVKKGKVYFLLCLSLISYFYSALTHAEEAQTLPTPKPLLHILTDAEFQQRWQRCGQNLNYRPPDEPVKNKLPWGTAVLVADFYRQAGFKCYLDEYNDPFIIQRYPSSKEFSVFFKKSSRSRLLYTEHYRALYDFLSSDLKSDADFYRGIYGRYANFNLTILKRSGKLYGFKADAVKISNKAVEFEASQHQQQGEYYIEFQRCYYDRIHADPKKEGCSVLLTKNYSNLWIVDNTIYIGIKGGFTAKGELTLSKFAFTAPSANPQRNLTALTQQLGAALSYLNGLESAWVKDWINGSGILTQTDACKRRDVPNRERLQVWLKRYLAKQNVTLQQGETYYFSRDLGVYKLLDQETDRSSCQQDSEQST